MKAVALSRPQAEMMAKAIAGTWAPTGSAYRPLDVLAEWSKGSRSGLYWTQTIPQHTIPGVLRDDPRFWGMPTPEDWGSEWDVNGLDCPTSRRTIYRIDTYDAVEVRDPMDAYAVKTGVLVASERYVEERFRVLRRDNGRVALWVDTTGTTIFVDFDEVIGPLVLERFEGQSLVLLPGGVMIPAQTLLRREGSERVCIARHDPALREELLDVAARHRAALEAWEASRATREPEVPESED